MNFRIVLYSLVIVSLGSISVRIFPLAGAACKVPSRSLTFAKPIEGLEWAPNGQKLLLFFLYSPTIMIYKKESEGLVFQEALQMKVNVTTIVRSSQDVNRLAVGLSTGKIVFLDGTTLKLADESMTLSARKIHALNWVGSDNALLVYAKDPEPSQAGFDTTYADKSVLRYFDRNNGSNKEFTLENHLEKLQIAPSGDHIVLTKDCINRKKELLEEFDPHGTFVIEIYSFKKEQGPALKGQVTVDVPVKAVAWTFDSLMLVVILDSGVLQLLDCTCQPLKKWASESIMHMMGQISSSPVAHSLCLPTNQNSAIILDLSQDSPQVNKTIELNDSN